MSGLHQPKARSQLSAASLDLLSVLSPSDVALANRAGGLHAPCAHARDGTAGLQWREGTTLEDVLMTAHQAIEGACGTATVLHTESEETHVNRAAAGMVMLLGLAGGAVQMALAAVHKVPLPQAVAPTSIHPAAATAPQPLAGTPGCAPMVDDSDLQNELFDLAAMAQAVEAFAAGLAVQRIDKPADEGVCEDEAGTNLLRMLGLLRKGIEQCAATACDVEESLHAIRRGHTSP